MGFLSFTLELENLPLTPGILIPKAPFSETCLSPTLNPPSFLLILEKLSLYPFPLHHITMPWLLLHSLTILTLTSSLEI